MATHKITDELGEQRRTGSLLSRIVKRLIAGIVLCYLAILIFLMASETRLVYPGASDGDFEQSAIDHEEVWIDSSDGIRIHAWFLPASRTAKDPTHALVMCHGNAENIATMVYEADRYRQQHHLDVLIFDYRGYGKSPGTPYEQGVLEDANAAWRWLAERTRLPPDKIFVFGRSLGGGVAVHLASNFNAAGLILDRTFSSVADVAASQYWYIPVRAILRNQYLSTERIKAYTGPLLQLHGDVDEVIHIQFAKRLFELSPSTDKSFVMSPGTTHLDSWPALFTTATDEFIRRIQ